MSFNGVRPDLYDAQGRPYMQTERPEGSMTLYDLLRHLIVGGAWTEAERSAALTLVDELEQSAVFGTTAAHTTSTWER